MRVAIVGLGLMGGSLALALRRARPGWTIVGVDRAEAARGRAVELGAVEQAAADLGPADLVVLAVPVLAVRELLPSVAGAAADAVVTDLCSTKRQVVAWAAEAGLDLVGGHPLCGRELTGIDAASADLYEGAPWVLTRHDPRVEEMVEAAGARAVVMDADEHDRLVAGISHSAFVLSAAYMLACAGSPDWPEMAALAAGGFRDMTRLAAGDPAMYAGIAATNRDQLAARLDDFDAALARLRSALRGEGDLRQLLESAQAERRRWERSRE